MHWKLLVFCVVTSFATAEYNGTHEGILNKDCVNEYYRMFVTRTVPPRHYKYFHEAQLEDQDFGRGTDLSFRIVGGNQVTIEQVPYSVLYGLYCGGVLIAPDWVLTAAHCKSKEKYVYAGSSQRSLATKHTICAHFIHPLWDSLDAHNHDYDYQLVLLESPIPVTPKTRPVAIGSLNDIETGVPVFVSGWGHVRHQKGEKMQDFVRRVSVPIMDSETCRAMPNDEYHRLSSRMFCAGYVDGSKDACQGDSGGPAVSNGKLVGLVSFGIGCAGARQPGVYANVPMAREWIRQITALPL